MEALSAKGELLDLPHTWNGLDGQRGGCYYRGTCWYVHRFVKESIVLNDHVFLEFEGVSSSAILYFNGEYLGTHDGGYSTFRFEITKLLADENTIVVAVDNSKNENVYPQTADFTIYGGIYRDVNIITVSENHFSLVDSGSCGLHATPSVNGTKGCLKVEALITGKGIAYATLYDREGRIVATGKADELLEVENVHLWDGIEDPYLYKLTAQLRVDGEVVDEIHSRVGFRTFHIDASEGFFLNGRKYPLRGVGRHQDRPTIGNALLKKHHEEDIELIREVGANTIRLTHYQHDDYFLDLCDEYGFVVWAEIPYISRHMKHGNFNAKQQMHELIKQQYNHPSIACWGISNEITMYPAGKDRLLFHEEMQEYCHKLDSTRPTTIACYVIKMNSNKLNRVPDLVAYNLYYGWYFPYTQISAWKLDRYHRRYPNEPLGLSEYGAEAMPNLHSSRPCRGDNTEEYQSIYHEKMIQIIDKREYLWATHLWNMFDFASDRRNQGGEPGMNHKGLITFDRKTKKDSFYLYKANWSSVPFVHICGKRFEKRLGRTTIIKVYSNQEKVDLYHNDSLINGKKEGRIFTYRIQLAIENQIIAKSGALTDETTIYKVRAKESSYRVKRTKNKSWQK